MPPKRTPGPPSCPFADTADASRLRVVGTPQARRFQDKVGRVTPALQRVHRDLKTRLGHMGACELPPFPCLGHPSRRLPGGSVVGGLGSTPSPARTLPAGSGGSMETRGSTPPQCGLGRVHPPHRLPFRRGPPAPLWRQGPDRPGGARRCGGGPPPHSPRLGSGRVRTGCWALTCPTLCPGCRGLGRRGWSSASGPVPSRAPTSSALAAGPPVLSRPSRAQSQAGTRDR